MFTKSEITKKRGDVPQQLALIESVTPGDKLYRKRKWVIIAIFLTIGLSGIFSLFRYTKTYLSSSHSLTPNLSLLSSDNPPSTINSSVLDIDSQISQILDTNSQLWNVTISANPGPPTVFNWSRNKSILSESEISTIYNKLSQSKVNKKSIIQPYLPQGIEIKEELVSNNQSNLLHALVTVPHKQIIIIISYQNPDSVSFKQQLAPLIPALYWSIMQPLN